MDLAALGARQCVDELELLRQLLDGESLAAQKRGEVGEREDRTGTEHDERAGALAAARIGRCNCGGFGDRRMPGDQLFHLAQLNFSPLRMTIPSTPSGQPRVYNRSAMGFKRDVKA